jgi:predicted SAM-dependent methyltransferase
MKDKLKLHLGCGKVHIPGFVNIDQYDNDSVNVVDDVKKLSKFQSNSVDLIYAAHVLEHFTRWEYKDVLRRWKELLKPIGILRIAVPDFEVISKYYIKTKDINTIKGTLYGHQDYAGNYHHWCWDFDSLKFDLEEIGFKNVKRYNFKKTEHANIKDWSWDHLPRHDENGDILPDELWTTGTLVSLNVECNK